MEKLSLRKKQNIVGQFLSGLSYDEIAAKTRVSKGTVANVVADLKAGAFPEAADPGEQIELLRELSIDLKRLKLSPGQCAVGLTVLGRIEECGLTPADIDRLPVILNSAGSEEEAREFIGLVRGIHAVQQRTGLSIDELANWVQEMEKKAKELEPIVKQCEALHQEIVELTEYRDGLDSDIPGLQDKLELLTSRVSELEQREKNLLRRNKDMEAEAERAQSALGALKAEKKALAEVGLSLEDLADVGRMAQNIARHHGVTSADLVKKLLQWLKNLDKAMDMEKILGGLRAEKKEQERAITSAQQELEGLKAAVAAGKKEKVQLDAGLKSIREEIDNTINAIAPSAEKVFEQCRKELQAVRDEAVKAGKEIGRIEHIVECNQWILDLLAMIQRDRVVEPGKVKGIMLLVMLSFSAWLKIQEKALGFYSLAFSADNLIKDLGQWKA